MRTVFNLLAAIKKLEDKFESDLLALLRSANAAEQAAQIAIHGAAHSNGHHPPTVKRKKPGKQGYYKGKHWTQTPAGRKRMSAIQKALRASNG